MVLLCIAFSNVFMHCILLLFVLLFMHCILYILFIFNIFHQNCIIITLPLGGSKQCHSFLDPEKTLIPSFCKDDAAILLFHYIPLLDFVHIEHNFFH